MANFFVAGAADDVGYATAERLADMMSRLLPDACLTKFMLAPEQWPAFLQSHVRGVLGTATPTSSPVVWDVSGRLVGSHVEFAALVRKRYGLEVDVSPEELADIAAANADEAAQQLRRRAVLDAAGSGRRALIIVDIQNDFCEDGALEVPGANAAIPVVNRVRRGNAWDLVVLTQDWHPAAHTSFASNHDGVNVHDRVQLPDVGEQVMWPDHCVQGSIGADFHPYLDRADTDVVVRMGTNPKADSYSAFGDAFGGRFEKTELEQVLRDASIDHVFIVGLAYDFCVSFTAKDAAARGFSVFVVEDGTSGIADSSIASETAAMKAAGVRILPSGDLPSFGKASTSSGEAEYKRAETARSAMTAASKRALVVVDVQNDFCEGGALEVPRGSEVVPVINQLRGECEWDLVVFTQDHHPPDHVSFASNNPGTTVFARVQLEGIGDQTMWPDHCVQGSLGASFHADLDVRDTDPVVLKGKDRRVDSYSGFGDKTGGRFEKTELESVLRASGIKHVFVVGLATDYCVSFTAKDAARLGFHTTVITDACRGLSKDTVASEELEWARLGVSTCHAADVTKKAVPAGRDRTQDVG